MPAYLSKPVSPRINAAHPMSRGSVAAWLMSEGSGHPRDYSGNNRHGVLSGTPPTWITEHYGPSLAFGGGNSGNYIAAPNIRGLAPPLTILARVTWKNVNGIGWDGLFSNSTSLSTGLHVLSPETSEIQVWANGSRIASTLSGFLALGEQINVGIVLDGGVVRFYRNGALHRSRAGNYSPNEVGDNCYIGTNGFGLISDCWDGDISTVQVFNRALSADEHRAWNADPFAAFRRRSIVLLLEATIEAMGASTLVRDAISAGYLVAAGHVAAPSGDELNPAAVIAAARAGWTLAELYAVAAPKHHSTLRVIGDPLTHLNLPKQGYNVYSRLTPTGADTLVGVAAAGESSIDLSGFASGGEQWIHVRAVDALGQEDTEPERHKLKRVVFDADGNLIAAAPNRPIDLRLSQAAGVVTARWGYRPNAHEAAPASFRVYAALGSSAFDYTTPAATTTYSLARSYSATLGPYAHGTIVRVKVSAVSAAGGEALNPIEQVITVDTQAPDAPASITVEVTSE